MSLPFSYEDRYPESTFRQGYGATNEEPALIRGMIKPFSRGLGICSAGEVAFLALLPKTLESLTLVDHSYSSLRVFCLKALLLAERGPVATRKLLIDESPLVMEKALTDLLPHLPSSLPAMASGATIPAVLKGEAANVRREWFYADLSNLKRAAANLHKVKLIHGDLRDAQVHAPFDFLYLSNALEHTGRGEKIVARSQPPDPKLLSSSLLTRGASILWTKAQGSAWVTNKLAEETWKRQHRIRGYRTHWDYILSQNQPPEAK